MTYNEIMDLEDAAAAAARGANRALAAYRSSKSQKRLLAAQDAEAAYDAAVVVLEAARGIMETEELLADVAIAQAAKAAEIAAEPSFYF